ncbi:pyrroline-5-carboxylate reductase [Streptococcus ictaluri]|uniref:Pyrroline-5-carboxylate reductase n=1 Tax=Streptococcus ictaluri 707-05 TaxID=764299 RepID=G5K4M0_9STRE|nr:pyrroline-5-carboxylate reductase [Streptococcus ictaluri]EHI69203.1 pyrroline-5-carboxylate reductase [Streptococcus ictaluri 707-05]
MKIGFIGVGKMASAIIKGIKNSPHDIIISGSSLQRSQDIAKELQVAYALSHQDLIDQADLVILGIKPQLFETVLSDLHFKQPIMSMAAGISLARLAELTSSGLPLLRIMPNMNANILESTTALTANQWVDQELFDLATELTDSFGKTFPISEKDFDTFTALAGSSPAYIYLFIKSLAKSGVKNGLPKEKALDIVTQTIIASAKHLAESHHSPHDLIDQICSPGGTTIAGLMDLEKNRFSHSVCSAIDRTIQRAKEL